VLQKNERTFLVFSAHSTWGPDYCLGIMGIDEFKDPLLPDNWWHNDDGCVFSRNDEENVFCTGHAAFTTSPGN
jgi:GH43 family beta-xylosidase